MKTRLYKKWLKYLKRFDKKNYEKYLFDKKNYEKYVSALGDKFFEKYIKYSRFWHKIKVECDLNGYTLKGIHCQNHPLHSYCPSVRLNNWQLASNFICDIDFAFMYQPVLSLKSAIAKDLRVSNYMQIPEVAVDIN